MLDSAGASIMGKSSGLWVRRGDGRGGQELYKEGKKVLLG